MKKFMSMLFPLGSAQKASLLGFSVGPARTVDSALVHFTKAIDELRAVEAEQVAKSAEEDAKIAKANQAIAEAGIARAAAQAEARRALSVIGKIDKLLA